MIKLTRLDGEPFVLNADMIMYVESRPDTFITLSGGERIVVGESMDEVVERAGLNDALRRAGAEPGDTVIVGGAEFEFA